MHIVMKWSHLFKNFIETEVFVDKNHKVHSCLLKGIPKIYDVEECVTRGVFQSKPKI